VSKYILAFHGGNKPESQEEGAKQMEKYQAWLKGLGDAAVEPGMPLGMSKVVSSNGIKDSDKANSCSGLQMLNADSMEAAIEFAKSCPFLAMNGTIEVTEVRSFKKP